MNRGGLPLIALFLILAAAGALAFSCFEIYPRKKYTPPSREVSADIFYAMEKWLKETGCYVKTIERFTPNMLEEIPEKVVIYAPEAKFPASWDEAEKMLRWIERGGFLVICISGEAYGMEQENENQYLLDFLSNMGVAVELAQINFNSKNVSEDEAARRILRRDRSSLSDQHPDFSARTGFKVEDEKKNFTIEDEDGIIRLVEISIGSGALTVTGDPVFMYNHNLEKEANAVLAWRITGGRTEGGGVLFVRERIGPEYNSIFGAIMERGNLIPVIISAVILIILGFWMVIPVFGLVLHEKQFSARPIKDRFTAEIRFLKKYGALNHYLHVYKRGQKETNLRCEDGNSEKGKKYNYRELINQYRRIFNGTPNF